jgi:uncharacterized damage-inducible protein DinB
MRWQGISPKAMLNPDDFPDANSLKIKWAEVEKNKNDFFNELTEESLMKVITYINTLGEQWSYPLEQTIHQVVIHSSYHRGQVTTMLRQLGAAAVPLDFLVSLDMQNKFRQ